MFKYSKDGISVVLTIDFRREKKDAMYPVKIQVVHNRKQRYYPTGKDLTLDGWEKLRDTKSKNLIEIRRDLQHSFDKVKDAVQQLEFEDAFTFDALNSRLSKGSSDTINTFFQAKVESLLQENRIGSYNYYKDSLNAVERFAGENIPVAAITVEWLKKFEKHILKQGLTYSTVGMRCRAVRAIMNDAKKVGIIKDSQYPFGLGKYEIPSGEGRKMALTLQQIKLIVSYTDGNPTTERYRDLWVFSYLCNGINFADMLRLKYSNIVNGEICFMRQKTIRTTRVKKELYAIVTPQIQNIIDRWGNPDKKPDSYIFPYMKGGESPMDEIVIIREVIRRCNKRMKEIGKAVGIDGISTYTARHSYATVLKRSGANIAYISESLGHNDLKTTENYLASFEREEREKNAKLLTNFDN
jgi:integrase